MPLQRAEERRNGLTRWGLDDGGGGGSEPTRAERPFFGVLGFCQTIRVKAEEVAGDRRELVFDERVPVGVS